MTDNEHTCPACRGSGTHRSKYDACPNCDGSGRIVTCLGCGGDMPEPQALEDGAFCADCRAGDFRDERAA